jgi:hypothetical protein
MAHPPLTTHPHLKTQGAATDRAVLAAPVPVGRALDLAGPAARADPAATDPVVRVDLATTDLAVPVVRVDPVTTDLAVQVDPVDPATTDLAGRVDPVITDRAVLVARDSTGPVDRAGRVDRGTAMTTAATSTTRHGATAPHPGVPVSRRGRRGIAHFRRPVAPGTTGRSTTSGTTKTRSGTRSSTSSDSTSSEFGSRCKDLPHQTPASPIGGAGVAL